MGKLTSIQDELYGDVSRRFEAVSQLFDRLRTPKATEELLVGLVRGDGATINRLLDGIEVPVVGKCFWLRSVVERVLSTPTGYVTECWIRDNLTQSEKMLLLLISLRHTRDKVAAKAMEVTLNVDGRRVVPPGEFLDELKANGLVDCAQRMTYDTGTALVLGPPENVCV